MGSSFFGRPNMGGGSSSPSSSSSSSSRKGKKSNSEKPKQPQRGLGVAQLEKIRLQGEMGCNSLQYPSTFQSPYTPYNQEDMRMQGGYSSSSPTFPYAPSTPYGFHPNMMMGLSEYERAQPNAAASWNPNYGILESQHFAQPSMTRHFLHEDQGSKRRNKSVGSSSQNSGSSETQDLDLELRLSL